MKNSNDLARRQFLKSSGALAGVSMLRLSGASLLAITQAACGARDNEAEFKLLGEAEGADIAAIAARIIPTTETPGATEAGVVWFFDQALAESMAGMLEPVRRGLGELNATVAAESATATRFAELAQDVQDRLLREIESSEFFWTMRNLTVFGFFAMQRYGGNRDHVGWDLIGFDGHHGPWEYPFGHYDAELARGGADG